MKKAFLILSPIFFVQLLFAQTYNIIDFGAIGDGKTNNTESIQQAINSCSQTGGTVLFPMGEFLTGSIEIKSNVTIELSSKAIWLGIPDTSFYPPVYFNDRRVFIYSDNAENITITGTGTINGNGDKHDAFPAFPGGQDVGIRPYGFIFWKTKNITIRDVTLKNSAFWMLRPDHCDDVMIHNVKVFNHANYNNDGFDISDCHRVTISDCILDCEDDAICLKSHSSRGVIDVVVTNCIVSSHASGLKLGTASYGPYKRILFSNCIIKPSLEKKTLHPHQLVDGITGICLTNTDGGSMSNIRFDNILIDGVETPIFVKLGNRRQNRAKGADATKIEYLSFSNIRALNAGPVCSSITGFPENYIEKIKLSNIEILCTKPGTAADTLTEVPEYSSKYPGSKMHEVNLSSWGLFLRHVKDIQIENFTIRSQEDDPRYDLYLDDVHGFQLSNFEKYHPSGSKMLNKIQNCSDIQIEDKILK